MMGAGSGSQKLRTSFQKKKFHSLPAEIKRPSNFVLLFCSHPHLPKFGHKSDEFVHF